MSKKFSMTIDYPPVVVWRSRALSPATDFTKPPEYDAFKFEPRLKVLDIFFGSSIAGQSYAKLALATGEPITPQIDPENADAVLSCGDRIAVGFLEGNTVRWRWAGYVVTAAILIQDDNEQLTYRAVGPEWTLGDAGSPGSNMVVAGQIRRKFSADDSWSKATGSITPFNDLIRLADARCVFNEGGHKNMSKSDVILTAGGAQVIKGRIFDEPDRRVKNADATEHWNVLQAAKLLCTQYNHADVSGIGLPKKWDDESLPFTTYDPIRPSDSSELEVDCEGSLWAALSKILHPRFAFHVDPTPQQIRGKNWGPFPIVFFGRGQVNPERVPEAKLFLNQRGTPMQDAVPCVSRLEAARDTAKIVNRMIVIGRRVQHVRLVFWGGATPTVTDKKKCMALQSAWSNADDKLNDYAALDENGKNVVTIVTVDKDATKRAKWNANYCTYGKEFANHEDAFRKFVWNEAGEYDGFTPAYNGGGGTLPLYRPDLSDVVTVADADGKKEYTRRRRPVMDCAFLPASPKDEWQKKPALLYFAIAKTPTDTAFDTWNWKKVSTSFYDLDPIRAGVRITVDNIADWRPFHKDDKDADAEADKTPHDPRTYATLLNAGVLRMCLEGTIEMDSPLIKTAEPGTFSGTPHVRQHFVRGGNTFIKTSAFPDGFTSPTKLVPLMIDKSEDAQNYADKFRDAGEQQSVHASVCVEGDWPMQPIGSIIREISGRKIILASNAVGGRGAQIVAVRLDLEHGIWEYLTESAALALREKDRERFASGTKIYSGFDKKREFRR